MTAPFAAIAVCLEPMTSPARFLAVSRKGNLSAFGFPGGKVEPGETPAAACLRELHEETGLRGMLFAPLYRGFDDSGHIVQAYLVGAYGNLLPEPGTVCEWVDRNILLTSSPYPEYNKGVFEALDRFNHLMRVK